MRIPDLRVEGNQAAGSNLLGNAARKVSLGLFQVAA